MRLFHSRGCGRRAAAFACLFLFQVAGATRAQPASYAELWHEVEAANPVLAAAVSATGMAAGDGLQAALRPNPVLQLSTENLGTGQREDTLAVAQTIELGGKRAARIALADRGMALAEDQLALARTALRADFRQAFVELLAAQERLTLADESLALTELDANSVRQQIAAGRLARLAAARVGLELSNARLEAGRARSDLKRAQRRLGAMLGSPSRVVAIDGKLGALPSLPALAELEAALPAAPALAAASAETARRAAQIQLERAERHGNLTFSAGVRYMTELNDPAGVLQLSVPLPLSNRNQGNLARAQGAAAQAAALEKATHVELARELEDAHLRYEAAAHSVAEIRTSIEPAARGTLDSLRRGFELGKFGLTELLDARRTLLRTRRQLIDAMLEAQIAATDIMRALGDEHVVITQ
jgi:cobalt-zinc-cadmium efflux system outer membrane protein